MDYMKNRLGAWQVGGDENSGRVEFKLFLPAGSDPEIASIRVAGDFQKHISAFANWDFANGFALTPAAFGTEGTIWSCCPSIALPADFYQYKYQVAFTDGSTRIVSDPCTRYGGIDHQNAAFVIGGSRPAENLVPPVAGGRKPLADLIVYEMMVDDFTAEYRRDRAPLDAAADAVPYLKALGFNAVLLMPVSAWLDRNFDWGYAPYHYFAIEYRYANDLEHPSEKIAWLKRFVTACHTAGIHVILDGVFNHASPAFPYRDLYLDPSRCPYAGDFGGTFTGLQDLNFHNNCTQEFVRDVCLYWLENFGIDGIRFDNTVNFYDATKNEGLPKLLQDIRAWAAANGQPNLSLTLEHINMSAADVTNKTAATSYWDDSLYGSGFGYLWDGHVSPRLLAGLNNRRYLTDPARVPTLYLSNHDHSHAAWRAGARDGVGMLQWYKLQPLLLALYTAPATPLIPNGQEFAEAYWIPEDDQNTGRRVLARPLHWKATKYWIQRFAENAAAPLDGDSFAKPLLALHAKLGAIRQAHPALRSPNFHPPAWEDWMTRRDDQGYGLDTDQQVAVFHRWGDNATGTLERFIVVINFSAQNQTLDIPFSCDGPWQDLLNATTVNPSGCWLRGETVPSYWGRIYCRTGA